MLTVVILVFITQTYSNFSLLFHSSPEKLLSFDNNNWTKRTSTNSGSSAGLMFYANSAHIRYISLFFIVAPFYCASIVF